MLTLPSPVANKIRLLPPYSLPGIFNFKTVLAEKAL